jgi:hypothetical protein
MHMSATGNSLQKVLGSVPACSQGLSRVLLMRRHSNTAALANLHRWVPNLMQTAARPAMQGLKSTHVALKIMR